MGWSKRPEAAALSFEALKMFDLQQSIVYTNSLVSTSASLSLHTDTSKYILPICSLGLLCSCYTAQENTMAAWFAAGQAVIGLEDLRLITLSSHF